VTSLAGRRGIREVDADAVGGAAVDEALDALRDRIEGKADEGETKEKGPERHESWPGRGNTD
jgi:hypothetical protein